MQVFLVRHAEAVAETVAVRDLHRHLSVIGRTQARALGDRMRWHDCSPTKIWTSPLVRAVQTAELVATGMHCELPIESMPALAPDGAPRDVIAALQAMPDSAAVVLVGHEPSLSAVGAAVTGDAAFASLVEAEAVRIFDGKLRWRFVWDADEPKR